MFFKPVDPSGKSARVVIYDELTNKVIASNDQLLVSHHVEK